MSDLSKDFRKYKLDLSNENSPLYNFMRAKSIISNSQQPSSEFLKYGQCINNINNYKSYDYFEPSKKTQKIMCDINAISSRLSDIASENTNEIPKTESRNDSSSDVQKEENKHKEEQKIEDRVNDSMLDDFRKYIIFKKSKEFQSGKPIWKIVQDDFERKISYDKLKYVDKKVYHPKPTSPFYIDYRTNTNSNKIKPIVTTENHKFNKIKINNNNNTNKYYVENTSSCTNNTTNRRRNISFMKNKLNEPLKKLPAFHDLCQNIPDFTSEKNEKIYANFELYDKYNEYQSSPFKF